MKSARSVSISRFFIAVIALLIAVSALAQKKEFEPVGRMSASSSAVSWQPTIEHEKLVLTVQAPDGTIYTKEFAAGSTPQIRLGDIARMGDGAYTYSLAVVPRISAQVKEALAAARAADDDAEVRRIQHANGLDVQVTQSGTLTVRNGSFINSDAAEPPQPNRGAAVSSHDPDREAAERGGESEGTARYSAVAKPFTLVTAQDEVIQGSLCVGLDCATTESFGFDTIKLKENNTRIHFNDTSTSTGFPNVNWQLTANDSGSGGANKFSIEDLTNSKVPFTVTAAAPTNSLFVASSGKVGFGNNNPGLNLHITATDTPAIRQEQTNGGGFTAQTWDIGANEANWFVRDLTGGSRLPFRIRPGAPTSSIDIAASGQVGVGTASPQSNLHVFGSSTSDVFIGVGENPSGSTGTQSALTIGYGGSSLGRGVGFFNVRPDSNATAPNPSLRFLTGNNLRMMIDNNGNVGFGGITTITNPIQHSNGAFLSSGGTWTNASSREYKHDITTLGTDEAVDALKKLQPVHFTYNVDPTEKHVGFIAEDVPNLVATKDRKSLSPMDIVAVLTKVVQEQQSTIDALKARLDQLEKEQQQKQ